MMTVPWQDGAFTLKQRVERMWRNGHFTDHTIKVNGINGSKVFKINKIFLAIASPYFEGLFYGPLSSEDFTELKDIDPSVFEMFLSFIYTDVLVLGSFNSAKEMYILADRFLMPHLKKLCLNFIEKHTSKMNAGLAYEFHKFYGNADLLNKLEEVIKESTSSVLRSNEFPKIQKETLLWILKQDTLKVKSELEVYNAAVKWIEAAKQREENMSDTEIAELTSEILRNIRFLSMTVEEFTSGPVIHPYISSEDKVKILTKISYRSSPVYPTDFCKKERNSKGDEDYSPNDYKLPMDWRCQLYRAVEECDLDKMRELFQKGADISIKYGKDRRSLLHIAAKSGSVDALVWLLDSKAANINETNRWGWAPIHLACSLGYEEVVALLIYRGADTNALTKLKRSPLDVASQSFKDVLLLRYPEYFHFPPEEYSPH